MKKSALSLLVFVLTLVSLAQEKKENQPNVLFFLVDDLGWNDIGTNGSLLYETPNIDALSRGAMYFSNAYSAYPRCVPSRHAMISGRHPARNGKKDGGPTPLEIVTIAEAMKANGYSTFFAGKWHLGHDESAWPHNQGFDVNIGGCASGAPGSYFFPYHDISKDKNSIPYYGLEEGVQGEYITDRLTNETIQYIAENNPNKTGKPFLAYLAHYAVHTPLQAKPERIAYYEDKIRNMSFEGKPYLFGKDGRAKMWQDNAVYAAMVESMDESLGRVIAKLKELGIYKNTIIIFTSDHGGLSNSGTENKRELATTNKPLRAGKGHIYEGGIKVPVFVRWPGHVEKKSQTESIITGMDYYPSILEMCGLPLQPENHLDGVSFVSALKDEKLNEKRPFYWHQTSSRPTSTGDNNSSVIRIGKYKLHHFLDNDRIELYDLKKDPYEGENIAESSPNIVKNLNRKLDKWKNEIGTSKVKGEKIKTENAGKSKNTKKTMKPVKSKGQGLKNGSFKEGTAAWSAKARKGTNVNLLLTKDAADGEKAAVAIVTASSGKLTNAMLVSDTFSKNKKNTLAISFKAKTDANKKNIKLQVQYLGDKGNTSYRAANFEIGTNYKSYSATFKSPDKFVAKSINVRFHFGEADGEYFFDQIEVK